VARATRRRKTSRRASAYERARRRYRPGQGGRFRALVQDLKARGYSEERARAIAASIGQRKWGKRQMARWAAAGRRRARRR
jgi:hypothetical protein